MNNFDWELAGRAYADVLARPRKEDRPVWAARLLTRPIEMEIYVIEHFSWDLGMVEWVAKRRDPQSADQAVSAVVDKILVGFRARLQEIAGA